MIDRRLVVAGLAAAPLSGALSQERPASDPDHEAIRTAALDYIEGWYAGDAARMERALHPELAKRILMSQPDGTGRLEHMGALTLVQKTRAGIGRRDSNPRSEVVILDRFAGAASVRINASMWVDYLHLAKVDGAWKIVNVLWETHARLTR